MTTLPEFILARIAEDEAAARPYETAVLEDAPVVAWGFGQATTKRQMRALADCEAKRRIVDWLTEVIADKERVLADPDPAMVWAGDQHLNAMALAVQALASVYADHPDYREEWRP